VNTEIHLCKKRLDLVQNNNYHFFLKTHISLWPLSVGKESASSAAVGEMEITPVSKAVARHLGIDLSPEGKAARNRRGIAIIVNGAPLSGEAGDNDDWLFNPFPNWALC